LGSYPVSLATWPRRHGTAVVRSGCTATEEQVRSSYWQYRSATIFVESAIAADLRRQNFTTFPRGFYVDMLKTCRACQRPFLFFAREQQHWYEELGFYVDADCVRCVECRRSEQQLRRRFRRYSQHVARADLGEPALEALVGDAVYLWQAGILRSEQQLRRLRNLARRRLSSNNAAAKRIERAVAELEASR
jgi:hypothetical protein